MSEHIKQILHSKRANIFYLERCRVLVNGDRVEYLTQDRDKQNYWNIPHNNTTVILLGAGTSITQAAERMLAASGVVVGFCGGGGTPLCAGTEVEWLTPQNEYRPTEYVQKWVGFWFDENKRLEAAKDLMRERIEFLQRIWDGDEYLQLRRFSADDLEKPIKRFKGRMEKAGSVNELLACEGELTKSVYKAAANRTGQKGFVREQRGTDMANKLLDKGNYLAYGQAATALWCLGIPFAFPLLHGKTRRGALVFDIADLIKDATVLPNAFISANEGHDEQEFRDGVIEAFTRNDCLEFMFRVIERICARHGSKIPKDPSREGGEA